jgi:AraC family transcriptional regulator
MGCDAVNVLEHLNKAMAYIEDNLGGDIDFQKLARLACCSEYHFRRMFSFLAGMPLGEYIRGRRLSVAASLLKDTDEKIIDVAMRFGYESPDAFTKAFQAMFGITPMQVKNPGFLFQHSFL